MYAVTALPAFDDNYLWLLHRAGRAVVVDPGDAAPVEAALSAGGLVLEQILVTHHHGDHIGGVAALAARHRVPVLAPVDDRIAADVRVRDGDRVVLDALATTLRVLEVPGHTRTHVAYVDDARLFCGDTLFAGGCGRLFEGTAAEMHRSLEKLAALPPATAVHCAHEYTVANLRFAAAVEPRSDPVAARLDEALATRARGEPTVPSTIALERATNPFLRCDVDAVRDAASRHAGRATRDAVDTFAVLREWKNHFGA